MLSSIVKPLKPEEEELLRKRGELAAIRTTLADRELDLLDFRSELAAFESRYLRQVGTLYSQLDEWKARVSELQARLDPSEASNVKAEEARERARQTYEDAHGTASDSCDFTPSPDLKRLFREVAKRIHPDFAKNSVDLDRRTRLMAEANRTYERGETEILHRILDEYENGADATEDEGVDAELIRVIRQISAAKTRITTIEKDLDALRQSEIALLMMQAEERRQEDRDLLAELEAVVSGQLERTKKEYEILARSTSRRE